MQTNHQHFLSSQASPHNEIWGNRQDIPGMYTHIFYDDFCGSYMISLSPNWNENNFYEIKPAKDTLESLLSFTNSHFLRYDFDKLLSEITHALVTSGKAYVEIILWKDNGGSVRGISFNVLKPILAITGLHKSHFISRQYSNKINWYCIENKKLIMFSLNDLGYSSRYFSKMLKRINKYDIIKVAGLTMDKDLKFDFSKYVHLSEYNLLKSTKDIYWYGRNSSNQYLNDFYLMWREVRFRELKKRILDYYLEKINAALIPYRKIANFSGVIIANCKTTNYSEDFEKLMKGEISISQFSDKFYAKEENRE